MEMPPDGLEAGRLNDLFVAGLSMNLLQEDTLPPAVGSLGRKLERSSNSPCVRIYHAFGCCVFDRLQARVHHCPNAHNPAKSIIKDPAGFVVQKDCHRDPHSYREVFLLCKGYISGISVYICIFVLFLKLNKKMNRFG